MKTYEELEARIAEIDKAYAELMGERQRIVATTHPEAPEAKKRIAEIDAEIIVIMNERGDCVEAGHSQILAYIKAQ